MPFDIYAVPDEIWFKIALRLSLKNVLRLEATCKFLLAVVSSKSFWIKHLHALDQDHAPDLPRHVSVSELTWSELRTLVVRAHRRHSNYTNSRTTPLRPTREATVPIGVGSPNGALCKVDDIGWRTELLPGGTLLLVLWPAGYLQCWDVRGSECIWTYPPCASSGARGVQMLRVRNFSYDMQANGDVRVLVVSESTDNVAPERTLEIFQIQPQTGAETPLYKSRPKDLHESNGKVAFSKLSGDVLALHMYMKGNLVLTFWKEDRSVAICESVFVNVDLVDGYLIGVLDVHGSKSIIATLLTSIHDIWPRAATSHATHKLTLGDIPHAICLIPRLPHCRFTGSALSICTFHWMAKAERKRKGIGITVTMQVWSERTSRLNSVVYSFAMGTAADITSASGSEAVLPSDGLPDLTQVVHLKSTALTRQPNYSSFASQLSQTGSTTMFSKRNGAFVWELATPFLARVARKVVFRTFDVPDAMDMGVEFYSGAIYFRTTDGKSVVIQHFD